MKITLRPYQVRAADAIRAEYVAGRRAVLLALPTGGGKTAIFCWIAEQVAAKQRRINILVHRQELLRQTSEHLDTLGVSHGIIAPGHTMTGDLVQVSSVQTLARRLRRVSEPDLLIIDEAHHAQAGTWRRIVDTWRACLILGVTATPCRLDGKGLGVGAGGCFETLIEGPSVADLIEAGHLSQPIVYAPPTDINLVGLRTAGGDYLQRDLAVRVDTATITGCAVEHYGRICPGVPAIAFCASVRHAEHVAEQFAAAGWAAASLTGDHDDRTRKYRVAALGSGGLQVLTSCEIISEGTDIPVVTAAILLRPTQSLGLYLQQAGRCLRPHASKTNAIILDHAGNCYRHGLPDDSRSWGLAGIDKRRIGAQKQSARIRQCERCYAVFSILLTHCPQCGFAVAFASREIKQVDGTLQVVSAEALAKRDARQEVGRADSLDALEEIARRRGYKPGWAQIVWACRQRRRSRARLTREPEQIDLYFADRYDKLQSAGGA